MSISTRLTKLEQKLLPNKGDNIEVIICEEGETSEQARKRLGLNDSCEGKTIIFVIFD